jgi:branched-chain amino acid transport system permease protein
MKTHLPRIAVVALCACAVLAAPMLISPYSLRVLILALISAIAVVGLCLAFGYTGLIQLGQAAFVGIGAYTSALLTTRLGFDFWLALPAAIIVSAVIGMLIGAPMLRLRGHYLALATVGLNVTMEIVTKNWTSLTGGDDGLSGIPGIEIGAFAFSSDRSFYYLALGFLAVVALIGAAIRASHFGRAMIAVRDDELACGACGVRVFRTKLLAFTLASAYGGLSGVLYAHYANYIAPSDFDGVKAITLLVMLIVGGEASIPGAIAGAVLISFAPEWLRFLGEAYLTVFGIGVVIVLVLLPSGLAGAARSLGRRLPSAPRRV